ncbi:ABZJ_00895 family protein [Halovulum sp. GXIMD14793]
MQPSFPSILLRFFLVLLAVKIVLSGLIWVFPALENASMAVIAGIVAAMAAGQHYYSMTNRVPTSKESWRYALAFVFLEILKRFGINLRHKLIPKRSDKPIGCTRFDFMRCLKVNSKRFNRYSGRLSSV